MNRMYKSWRCPNVKVKQSKKNRIPNIYHNQSSLEKQQVRQDPKRSQAEFVTKSDMCIKHLTSPFLDSLKQNISSDIPARNGKTSSVLIHS